MASNLPTYIASAKPLPPGNRVQWFSNVAPTYAGVMVWFAFWQQIPGFGGAPGGLLSAGLMPALVGLVVAALICHYLFYLIPGLLGMKTGLPLYVVGTSTYGVRGGLIMPGLLMGALQFCWLGFNAFFVSTILCQCFEIGLNDKATDVAVPGTAHGIIAVAFAVFAAFVGLKGIQYVAKVATFLPIIPIVVLLILFVATVGGLGDFTTTDATNPKIAAAEEDETKQDEATEKEETAADAEAEAPSPLGAIAVMIAMSTCIVGFFATAGAAGVDIAMNSKDEKNVKMGGLTGIAAATIFSGTMSLLIVAGYLGGTEEIPTKFAGNLNPVDLMKGGILSAGTANVLMILLAISSFPAACFSAMIAANCFRTTLPNVNPFISVGIGTAVACVMAVTGWAGDAAFIFTIIGASFGPVCGAMMADYLLAGKKWAGPRSGWNLAGWISWTVGFAVGGLDIVPAMAGKVPCPPMAAFVVGFVLYVILAKAGMESEKLEMPTADSEPAGE